MGQEELGDVTHSELRIDRILKAGISPAGNEPLVSEVLSIGRRNEKTTQDKSSKYFGNGSLRIRHHLVHLGRIP